MLLEWPKNLAPCDLSIQVGEKVSECLPFVGI